MGTPTSSSSSSSYNTIPLSNVSSYSDISIDSSDHSISLTFSKDIADIDSEEMFLTYAIGASKDFGYHMERHCFTIVDFPSCDNNDHNEEKETVTTINAESSSSSSAVYLLKSSASSSFYVITLILSFANTIG